MLNLAVIGGDIRQYYLLRFLLKHLSGLGISYKVTCYQVPFADNTLFSIYPHSLKQAASLNEALCDCHIVIAPVPLSKDGKHIFSSEKNNSFLISDVLHILSLNKKASLFIGGNISENIIKTLSENNIQTSDVMKDTVVVQKNAALTAEGLLSAIINHTTCTISNANILIMGYGNCGSKIADTLTALGGNIFVYDKASKALETAVKKHCQSFNPTETVQQMADFDIIINTIPKQILKAPFLRMLKKECVIFEIASIAGFDNDILKGLSIDYVHCPGIPGKTAPRCAGKILAEYIETQINQFLPNLADGS